MARPFRLDACSFLRVEFETFVAEEFPDRPELLRIRGPLCTGLAFRSLGPGGGSRKKAGTLPFCPLAGPGGDEGAEEAGCASLLAPAWLVRHLVAEGSFLFGPGWLQDWERNIEGWGFGEEELRDFARESIPRLCLLDSLVYPGAEERLAALSARLGVPALRIPLGLEHFREGQRRRIRELLGGARSRGGPPEADYVLALDILGRLAFRESEAEVLGGLFEILEMLFAPAELEFLLYRGDRPAVLWTPERGEEAPGEEELSRAERLGGLEGPLDEDGAILLPLDAGEERLGLLRLAHFALPERREDYRRLLEAMGPICAVALANARSLAELRRRNALALEAKQEELLASLAFRDRLLSIIGHDLRAPMGILVELLEDALLRLGPRLGEEERFLAEAFGAAGKSYELLQNLLDWSRIQTPGYLPLLEPLELGPLVEEVFALLGSVARRKGVGLSLAGERGLRAIAEARALETALRNLVSNAVKFSRPSSLVRVELGREDSRCLIRVVDEGLGMDPERLAGALSSGLGRSAEGTGGERGSGLGLLLVRELLEKLGGRLSLESELGRGTTALIELAAAPPGPEPPSSAAS